MDRKEVEWVSLNCSLLEVFQISGFLWAIKDLDFGTKKEIMSEALSPTCSGKINEILLFSGNIFRLYSITELHKIINPDSYKESITLFSFMENSYPEKNSEEWKEFSQWKKRNSEIRKKIEIARKKFSAHLDSDTIHGSVYFDLDAEKIDAFIKDTFSFLSFLYNRDSSLKKSFDQKVNPGLSQTPAQVSESWRNIMIKRINSLQDFCKK